ncbi:MAG: alcohol dehydrogenase catalytic domain-containing protein [Spirochaetaceae bacterium]|nr:MAG: alcohol dehydrogenase catalytic domain-containing protein [Spirochaetaceae bacterium]
MKAAVYLGGPQNIAVQDIPVPKTGKGEALLKIGACNICGVDLRTYKHGDAKIQPPRVLGHELSGTVVELEHGEAGVKVGDRIIMYVVIPCGTCVYCKKGRANLCETRSTMAYQHDGAFAEYMRVPKQALDNRQLIRIPEHISFEEAALSEPLGCVLNAHGRLNIGIKDTVVVIGAGPIGLLHGVVSKIEGANHVCLMDVSQKRLELAEQFGFHSYVPVSEQGNHIKTAQTLNDGLGPDVVIVACAAAQAQVDALEMAGKMARIEFFGGLPKSNPYANLNTNLIHYRELVLTGSFSSKIDDFTAALRLIVSGTLPSSKIITHRVALKDFLEAFEHIQSGRAIKVSIQPE